MVYAQIKNGIVSNTIVLNKSELEELFELRFDDLICIDEIEPRPGVGWLYSDGEFTAPPYTPDPVIEE